MTKCLITLQMGQCDKGDKDDQPTIKWHQDILTKKELSGTKKEAEADNQTCVPDLIGFEQFQGQHDGQQADGSAATGEIANVEIQREQCQRRRTVPEP